MVAPGATPSTVVAKLNKAAVEALNSPDVQEKLYSHGTILVGDTPDEFAEYIRREIEKWRKVARTAGVKPNPN
jgi:tripartite-type tricarboxylate transporter receptor subunit TctC